MVGFDPHKFDTELFNSYYPPPSWSSNYFRTKRFLQRLKRNQWWCNRINQKPLVDIEIKYCWPNLKHYGDDDRIPDVLHGTQTDGFLQ